MYIGVLELVMSICNLFMQNAKLTCQHATYLHWIDMRDKYANMHLSSVDMQLTYVNMGEKYVGIEITHSEFRLDVFTGN